MSTPASHVVRMHRGTPLARLPTPAYRVRRLFDFLWHPDTLELFWSLAALSLVAGLMMPLAQLVQSGDGRFNPSYLQSVQLPDPALEKICADFGLEAAPETALACGKFKRGSGGAAQAQLPLLLQQAVDGIARAFADPVRPLVAAIHQLEQRQRDGVAPDGADALDEEIAARGAVSPSKTLAMKTA